MFRLGHWNKTLSSSTTCEAIAVAKSIINARHWKLEVWLMFRLGHWNKTSSSPTTREAMAVAKSIINARHWRTRNETTRHTQDHAGYCKYIASAVCIFWHHNAHLIRFNKLPKVDICGDGPCNSLVRYEQFCPTRRCDNSIGMEVIEKTSTVIFVLLTVAI